MQSLAWREKLALTGRIWRLYLVVEEQLRRSTLPETVGALRESAPSRDQHLAPARLGRMVHRALGLRVRRPRCLIGALILYRILLEQGDPAELVIGMPSFPASEKAHAWVEIDGVDVGPPPGHWGHRELGRYS